MSAARPLPVNNPVVRYSGIYNADGGHRVLHRNELDEELSVAIRDRQIPIVLAHRADIAMES